MKQSFDFSHSPGVQMTFRRLLSVYKVNSASCGTCKVGRLCLPACHCSLGENTKATLAAIMHIVGPSGKFLFRESNLTSTKDLHDGKENGILGRFFFFLEFVSSCCLESIPAVSSHFLLQHLHSCTTRNSMIKPHRGAEKQDTVCFSVFRL